MTEYMPDTGNPIAVLARPIEHLESDERATLLIVAEGGRAEAISRWAERAGLRCIGCVAPESANERLAQIVALDLILLDLRGMDVAARISRATAQALTGRYGLPDARLVVITDLAALDCTLAMLDSPETEFLCEPQDSDIVTLLVIHGLRQGRSCRISLNDSTRDSDTARFERLSEEVRKLAMTIERMTLYGAAPCAADRTVTKGGMANGVVKEPGRPYRAGMAETTPDPARQFQQRERPIVEETDNDAPPSHAEVRALIRTRRMRDQYLPSDLFADPAWDMMLDLLAAKLSGQRVSVSSLCIAAAVPPTTALRWIRQLTDRSVFARIDDPADGRRVFIELTEAATQAVLGWAQAVRRNGGLLVKSPR